MYTNLKVVQEQNPLVHNITNQVVTNFTANGLLAVGASPVMANAIEEVAEMASIAGAVVLNIGTLTTDTVDAMIEAGKAANDKSNPVILDPVGAGATSFRTEKAKQILNEVNVTVLRGNAAEIAHLTGEQWEIKGVDSRSGDGDITQLAKRASELFNSTVVITGEIDVISNDNGTNHVMNGVPLLTKVTGSGCLLSSVIGAFAAVNNNILEVATSAVSFYGIAAEKAAKLVGDRGPGSFQIEFLNQLSKVTEDDEVLCNIERITK
uniref:hydroxyethylthiazole kinase n=1 Tax=uncultured Allobacillus sp. TaxID=1638025 RepID=UPI002594272A|nr:hydroxyethylthiazole kinase [uncultured Allobacillus sp.]